jgi:hypothetical protein
MQRTLYKELATLVDAGHMKSTKRRAWEVANDGSFVRLQFDRDGINVRQTAASYGNASGYGPAQPCDWEINVNGQWHRVYCAIYSNAGTCYIKHAGHSFVVEF